MPITKNIQINNGNVITIPSVHFWSNLPYSATYLPGGYNRGWGYDVGVPNMGSVLDLTQLYDAAMSKIGISTEIWQDFITWHTEEEMQSAAFQAVLDAVSGAIEWLWGSFEAGGYGFIKINQGVEAVWHQGIAFRDNGGTNQYIYVISRAGEGQGQINRDHLTDTVITCVDKGETMFPDIILWTSASGNYYFLLSEDKLGGADIWLSVPVINASAYAGDPSMGFSILSPPIGSYPKRPWYIDNTCVWNTSSFTFDELTLIGGWAGREVSDDYDPFEDTTGDDDLGGDGDWNGSSEAGNDKNVDDIDDDAINSGFVTLYKPTKPQIQQFSDWLWTSITDSLSQQIKRLLTNPLDGILFIATTHLSPPTSQGSKEIKFCGIGSNVYALTIPKQFKSYDCGDFQFLTIDGSYSTKIDGDTDTFLDYQPYSKAEIYLPCIGYKELDINDVIGSTIHLNYEVDWVSGACLAQLKFTRDKRKNGDANLDHNILYEFQGNIYTNLPISASDWKSFYSNVLQVGGGLASALSGNIGQGISQAVSSIATQQVSVQKSGNVAASYGYMGQQEIRIYITRPNPAIPTNYKSYKGYQSNKFYKLGDLSGYTEIDPETFWVGTKTNPTDGITEEEAKMLRADLASGFYL